MRSKVTKSKNSASLYVLKLIYNNKTQSNTSKIVEKLGTVAELREKLNGEDPYVWVKNYIYELNKKEKIETKEIIVKYIPQNQISKDELF